MPNYGIVDATVFNTTSPTAPESMGTLVRAVILDRDGVILEPVGPEGRSPRSLEEARIKAGIPQLLEELDALGISCVAATNQPEVARGLVTLDFVEGLHAHIAQELPLLRKFFVCYHDSDDECSCRKPQPGLVQQALSWLEVDADDAIFLGDRWVDIAAAHAAGCASALITTGHDWTRSSSSAMPVGLTADYVIEQPLQLIQIILATRGVGEATFSG